MSVELVPINAGSAPPIAVSRPVILVGRHPECDVRIDSPKISRRHCCLASAYERVLIRDLGSRNGVRVNGQIVEEATLAPGDEVAIGPFLYRVVGPEPRPAPGSRALAARPPAPAPAPAPVPAPRPDSSPIIDLDDDFVPLDD